MSKSSPSKAELNWARADYAALLPDIARSCRVTVVADPDGLLQDDLIATELREYGFDVLIYDDPVRFRFLYETRHRQEWDRENASSVVVGRAFAETDLNRIPHDVLWHARQAERVITVSFGELFKGLAADVLTELDKADLDALWLVRKSVGNEVLGAIKREISFCVQSSNFRPRSLPTQRNCSVSSPDFITLAAACRPRLPPGLKVSRGI